MTSRASPPKALTPSRLLLLLTAGLLLAPAAAAGLAGHAGFSIGGDGGFAEGSVDGETDDGAPASNDTSGNGTTTEPDPAPCCPTIQPWPCCNATNATFEMRFLDNHTRLAAGERRAVPFELANTGRAPLRIELFGEGDPYLKLAPLQGEHRLAPGERVLGEAVVAASPDAPDGYGGRVVLHGRAHALTEDCKADPAREGCHAKRSAALQVSVYRNREPGLEFGVAPEFQRTHAGGDLVYHVYAYNGGAKDVTLAVHAVMRAPDGWKFHLPNGTLVVPAGGRAAVPLHVHAADAGWDGERALFVVKAEDGAGNAYRARAVAEIGPDEVHVTRSR